MEKQLISLSSRIKKVYLPRNIQYQIEDLTPKSNSFTLSSLPLWKINKQ